MNTQLPPIPTGIVSAVAMAQPACDPCLSNRSYSIGMEFAVNRKSPVFQPSGQESPHSTSCLLAKSLSGGPATHLAVLPHKKQKPFSSASCTIWLLGSFEVSEVREPQQKWSSGPEDGQSWPTGASSLLPAFSSQSGCVKSSAGGAMVNRACGQSSQRLRRPNPSSILI